MYILKRNYTDGESEILYTLTDLEYGENLVVQLNSVTDIDYEWFTLHTMTTYPLLENGDKLRILFEVDGEMLFMYDFAERATIEILRGWFNEEKIFLGEGYSVEECYADAKAKVVNYE